MSKLSIPHDVPWVVAWTEEAKFEIRPCKYARGDLAMWQLTAQGKGKPIFSKPHFVRQRMSIAKMLCSVCGEPTTPDDRWMFPTNIESEVKIKGRAMYETLEAPQHRFCADFSAARCPHIRSKGFSPVKFPNEHYIFGGFIIPEEAKRDFGIDIPTGKKVIASLKLVYPKEGQLITEPSRYFEISTAG